MDTLPGWLQTRDSNPFALATGLPLAASMPLPGTWQIDTTLSIANTELRQFGDDSSLLFDAETHETRFSAAYAFDEHWNLARIDQSPLDRRGISRPDRSNGSTAHSGSTMVIAD